jgi:hypothetical protein
MGERKVGCGALGCGSRGEEARTGSAGLPCQCRDRAEAPRALTRARCRQRRRACHSAPAFQRGRHSGSVRPYRSAPAKTLQLQRGKLGGWWGGFAFARPCCARPGLACTWAAGSVKRGMKQSVEGAEPPKAEVAGLHLPVPRQFATQLEGSDLKGWGFPGATPVHRTHLRGHVPLRLSVRQLPCRHGSGFKGFRNTSNNLKP